MAKERNNSVIAKRNRNNRARGASMEKYTADYLDMDVVPYSGSNSRFGFGDIRDTIWLGECKNITPTDNYIVLKREWFDKNNKRALEVNRIPFLAFMIAGASSKYVVLEKAEWELIIENIGDKLGVSISTYIIDRASCKSINYKLSSCGGILKRLTINGGASKVILEGTQRPLYIINLALFKTFISVSGMKGSKEWKA